MAQRPARSKQLTLGVLALNVRGQELGHGRKVWPKPVKIKSKASLSGEVLSAVSLTLRRRAQYACSA
jgi:hypothetical protein